MGTIKKIKNTGTQETKTAVCQPLQFLSRNDYLVSIILTSFSFVVYAFTAAPGVTLADSGDFINGVLTLGIVHPPGYPLYTVLGHLFSLLPFGEPAFRVNLFSALWGSLCLGVMFLILRILSIDRTHAVFTALFLGFTTVFWSKTGVAEVYSFNAFLIACIVFCILSYNRDKKKTQLYLLFLTTGLALSNHYPLVILTGIGLVFLLDRRSLHAADLIKGFLFLVLGLTPYLYLFMQASNPDLQYNFGKLSDFRMVLNHILRNSYAIHFGGTVWDKLILATLFSKTIITNFLFSIFFLVSGLAFSFLHKWQYRYPLLLAALSPSLGLILILTFPSSAFYWAVFVNYLIPSFLLFSVFLAIGITTVMDRYVTNKIVQVSMLVIFSLTQAAYNFQSSSHHNDTLIEIWGTQLLNSLETKSSVILCGFGEFPIYYLQLIKGLRQDVTLYDRSSLYTKENLYQPRQLYRLKLIHQAKIRKEREEEVMNNSLWPVYYTCKDAPDQLHMSSSYSTPFAFRADKGRLQASDSTSSGISDRLLDSLANGYPKSDYWLDDRRKRIFRRLISYYGGHERPEVNRILDYFKRSKLYSDPEMSLSIANNLYYFKNYDLARKFSERAEELSLEAFSSTDLAVYCNTLAKARSYDKALGICIRQEQSSAPCEGNTVITRLVIAGIYKEQRNWTKVGEYSGKILDCQPDHEIARGYLMLATERIK